MTAPNLVDPNDPNLNPPPVQNQTSNTGNGGSDLSVDTTQPQDQGRELFLMALREQQQENARLRRELETRNNAPSPRVTGDPAWREMTEDPRRVIQEEVANAVKPLNDYVSLMQRREAFAGLKAQIAAGDPISAHILNKFGHLVDQALSQSAPTIDNVLGAINLVSGAIATGRVPGLSAADLSPNAPPARNNAPVNNNPPRVVPPSLAPSAHPVNTPPGPRGTNDKPWESMTETQLAMARHFKMTPEQYWNYLNEETVSVDTTRPGNGAKK